MRASRHRTLWLGAALIALGTALVAVPLVLPAYATWRQAQLAQATAPWRPARRAQAARAGSRVAATASLASQPEPALGQVAAYLRIPKIDVAATVLQGTSDALLASAPGHEPQSVMPGTSGTAVIVAHNLTFFRHIDALRPGDTVVVGTAQGVFTFKVTRSLVVPANSSLPNTTWPSLDLVACYPLNALYYTSDRYVVETALVSRSPSPAGSLAGLQPNPPQFLATLPANLASQPLWLSDTGYEVGRATFSGGPSQRLTASGASWSLVAQSIRMFAATVRALQVATPSPLAGFGPDPAVEGLAGGGPWVVAPRAPLDVSIDLDAAGQPLAVTVETPLAHIASPDGATKAPFAITLLVRGDVLYLQRAGTV
jgi:sortase A